MNPKAREFILNLDDEEAKKYKLAFSCKITKNNIVTDRVCIIYKNKKLDTILYVLNKITDNINIKNWVTKLFIEGKTVIFSFTENIRKIYIEVANALFNSEEFFNQSIEWTVNDEDNFIHRNYNWGRKNPDDYRDIIAPDFYKYINFNSCLLRTDGNVYIRHRKTGMGPQFLNDEMSKPLMKMLLNLQEDSDSNLKHRNIIKFKRWLDLHTKRKAIFNWIQVTNDSLTVYIC